MQCPRLDHFARIIPGKQSKSTLITNCCVMINAPVFSTYEQMMQSRWLKSAKLKFQNDQFPKECVRCQDQERVGIHSDRMFWLKEHEKLQSVKSDYLTVSLKLDNICNTACQFCQPNTSSKIASLNGHTIKIHETGNFYDVLPTDRITQIDFEGGEPSNSKNVSEVLQNLPKNVKDIKIYTNGRSFMKELPAIVQKGIRVQLSISLDGVGKVQEYVRWPTKWSEYHETVYEYKKLTEEHPTLVSVNFFTTICTLNINDLENIINYADQCQIPLALSKLSVPETLNITKSNKFTTRARDLFQHSENEYLRRISQDTAINADNSTEIEQFISSQDKLRSIDIKDFIDL